MKFASLFLLGLIVFPLSAACAQEAPVEISASGGLAWDRSARTYTARGDVVAAKGTAEVRSDTLAAFYSEAREGTDITRLVAEGHVVISSPPYKAYGDKGVYDVKTGNAVLTGQNLRIETETERLTARDKIEYFASENRMAAEGGATAVKNGQTLTADTLNAWFAKDAQGKMTTRKITSAGHIVITTEKEKIQGDAGVYDVPAGKAEITGNVKIYQGENFLEGTRATVDMKTGISQLFAEGNAATNGRVRGVFYPKKKTAP